MNETDREWSGDVAKAIGWVCDGGHWTKDGKRTWPVRDFNPACDWESALCVLWEMVEKDWSWQLGSCQENNVCILTLKDGETIHMGVSPAVSSMCIVEAVLKALGTKELRWPEREVAGVFDECGICSNKENTG